MTSSRITWTVRNHQREFYLTYIPTDIISLHYFKPTINNIQAQYFPLCLTSFGGCFKLLANE